jgi:hypothetical protein
MRKFFEDRVAGACGLIGTQEKRESAEHEHHGAPSGGFGEHVGGASRTESCLAARAAESSGEVSGLAALQQHHDDQHQTINHKKSGQEPASKFEAENDDGYANDQRESPLHCGFRFHTSLHSKL